MAIYKVNEGLIGTAHKAMYKEIEAASYKEDGSYTRFYDADDKEVWSIQTMYVQTISTVNN